MNLNPTPLSRMAESIQDYYVNHPELIEGLLIRMGAELIRHDYGHEIRCCCPLHGGKNPDNFVVYYDRGYPAWNCFSDTCGKGNLVTLLLKKYPAASFEQAVVSLGRFAGLQVEGYSISVSKQTLEEESLTAMKRRMGLMSSTDERPNMFPESMVQWAIPNLYQSYASHALSFLLSPVNQKSAWGEKCKQFPDTVLRHWQVGFVPGKQWLWPDPVTKNPAGYFEDRIVVPWRTLEGQCMGFAGRRIDGNPKRKWKTLPGTKRALALYGLSDPQCQAMIRSTGIVHLVEGYTDVWRAHTHGYFNTVAVGGTALTDEQRKLLSQFPLRLAVLFMDGDEAGRASINGLGPQLATMTTVMVATPPQGSDPGDLVAYEEFATPIVRATRFVPI